MAQRRRLRGRHWMGFALVWTLAAIAGSVACSFIVSDSLPSFACMPEGGSGACPPDQVCRSNPSPHPGFSCQPRCMSNSSCPGGSCDRATGQCVTADNDANSEMMGDDGGPPPADAKVDATADGDAAIDADAEVGDVAVACHGFGCKCASSPDCDPTFTCGDKQALTASIWSAWGDAGGGGSSAGHLCIKPCCTSGDCDMGDGGGGTSVCFATGAGGNYCVPPGWIGDRSIIGTAVGGASCIGDGGVACRSGLCLDSGVCADTCCSTHSTAECSGTSVCRFGAFPGSGFDTHEAANCAAPISMGLPAGTQCGANSECRSNLCSDGGFGQGMCLDGPCRNPSDCTMIFSRSTCAYMQPYLPMSPELVAACMSGLRGGGDAGDGMTCRTSSDCARGYCAMQQPGVGVCVAVCFVDDPGSSSGDCPPPERCRPQPLLIGGTTYSVLACGM
jgi:hypothetical protein